jgi:hypothetical protein
VAVYIDFEVHPVAAVLDFHVMRVFVSITIAMIPALESVSPIPPIVTVVIVAPVAVMAGAILVSLARRVTLAMAIVSFVPRGVSVRVGMVVSPGCQVAVVAAVVPSRSRLCHWSVPR